MTESRSDNVDLSALKIDRKKKSDAPRSGRKWLHLLWLLVPVIIYFGYQKTIKSVTPAVKIEATRARMLTGTEATAELVATGYVVAQVKAAVASKGTGRLEVLNVEEGDKVKSGEVLAVLDNSDIRAQLDLAKAGLEAARADSVQAAINLNRQQGLLKGNATTQDVVDVAVASFDRAVANMSIQRANIRSAEVALENTYIRAPFDGTVLMKHADVGEMVAPFASASSSKGAVVTIADMSSLEVEADVSESNIYKVKLGQPCEVVLDAYPGVKYEAFVKKIVPTADRSRATVLTKIGFKNVDDKVLPEMSARINFLPVEDKTQAAREKPTLAVIKTAVTSRNESKVVFKIVGSYVQETPIQTGRELGQMTEIISGLVEGDQVVVSPPGGMKTGDKVEMTK
jgi:RND family efflux transporter MFP subunit